LTLLSKRKNFATLVKVVWYLNRRLTIGTAVLEIAVQVNPAGNHPFANLFTNKTPYISKRVV